MKVSMIDLHRIYEDIKGDIDKAIQRVIENSAFILGGEVRSFEKAFASFVGARHAIGVGNGTDAITLALRACNVGPNDEVITTALSAFPTAEAVLRIGAKPVYVDIDPLTFTLDPSKLEGAITARTRAILPVHLYGRPASMEAISSKAQEYGLAIIEDCCQAHGARFDGSAVGTIGRAGCFSFFPSKNLGAMSDGGMVVTNEDGIAESIRMLRDHGRKDRYLHEAVGYNSRLGGLQAAILAAKLPHLERYNQQRGVSAEAYRQLITTDVVILPDAGDSTVLHVFHLFVLRLRKKENRGAFMAYLADKRIQTNIHYPVPLHRQPAFLVDVDLPVVQEIADQIVSIPLFPLMSISEVEYVADAINKWRG